jgi:hypothetical protein
MRCVSRKVSPSLLLFCSPGAHTHSAAVGPVRVLASPLRNYFLEPSLAHTRRALVGRGRTQSNDGAASAMPCCFSFSGSREAHTFSGCWASAGACLPLRNFFLEPSLAHTRTVVVPEVGVCATRTAAFWPIMGSHRPRIRIVVAIVFAN